MRNEEESPAGPVEIEVKLMGALRDLRAAFQAVDATAGRGQKLVSRYFDTPDRRLSAAGLTLRVRRSGRRHEMTLKQPGLDAFTRGEWSVPLPGPHPQPGLFPPQALRLLLDIEGDRLDAVMETEITRRTKLAERDGATIEVAFDQGRIVAGERETPVAELEFELKSGATGPMLALAEEMAASRGLGLQTRSKSERGMELAGIARLEAGHARRALWTPEADLGQALGGFVAEAARHAAANLAVVAEAASPEGVHQMRVALRRLRSAFSLFRPQLTPPAREADAMAREALKALGAARDLDVFVTQTAPAVMMAAPEQLADAMAALQHAAAGARAKAQADARAIARGPLMARLALRLHRLAAERGILGEEAALPAAQAAPPLLDRRLGKALKLGKGYARLAWPLRHEVRIAVKKLRYALDFFAPLNAGKKAKAFSARLSRLQDDMGAANDAHVAQTLAFDIAGDDPVRLRAAAFIAGWQARILAEGEAELVYAWKGFRDTEPFWR